jgi:hypothetical protein
MEDAIDKPKLPSIKQPNIDAFKKPQDERKYNTIVKSQSSAQDLMNRNQSPRPPQEAVNAERELIPIRPAYTEQTLKMIKGCLDIADKNLKDPLVSEYLVKVFGEEQANQILQQKNELQSQLVEDYNEIIKRSEEPKGKI